MFSLTHASIALAGAAAMVVPMIIHLLTLMRRQPQPWGAMRFVLEAYQHHRRRLQLERWLLLMTRCLLLLLLGLALSQPLLNHDAVNLKHGFGGWLGSKPHNPGRLVCLVIDDTLSSSASIGPNQTRLQWLKQASVKVIDQLSENDRVAIWRSARPGQEALVPAVSDRQTVLATIDTMAPRFSRGDLANTLALVDSHLVQQQHAPDRTFVVVLSDLANHTLPMDPSFASGLRQLTQHATLVVNPPLATQDNVQIADLVPLQRMILAFEGSSSVVPIELHLKRFGSLKPGPSTTKMVIELVDLLTRQPIATMDHELHWLTNQQQATIQIDLPLTWNQPLDPSTLSLPRSRLATPLAVQARLTSDALSSPDALLADNDRRAVLQLRQHLAVGLADFRAVASNQPDHGFSARHWVQTALAPGASTAVTGQTVRESPHPLSEAGIQLIELDASSLSDESASQLDAVFILRPDMLNPNDWPTLKTMARRGGLVWVFTPPDGMLNGWGGTFVKQFDLNWQVGLEAQNPQAQITDHSSWWSLAADRPAPRLLNLLSADWPVLLRPIRVAKRLDLALNQGPGEVWLWTDDDRPLMASARIDQGYVLLLATAIDPSWTNLPTKPLFVPLVHETLRRALGESGSEESLRAFVCGDQPTLEKPWQEADRLVITGTTPSQHAEVPLIKSNNHIRTARPLQQPGVYASTLDGGQRALTVNPDAQGGDTRAIQADQLARWLDKIGRWRWLDPNDPVAAFQVDQATTTLGWPLLWATLIIVLLEMSLSRWFSHVSMSRRRSRPWRERLARLMRLTVSDAGRGS